jgi:hypothetical protein
MRSDRIRVSRLEYGQCGYCGQHARVVDDHIVPKASGGLDVDDNKMKSCEECNKSKGKLGLDRWRFTLARRRHGSPYFTPEQISYLKSNGFDYELMIAGHAKGLLFFFEGGDPATIRGLVEKKSLQGY